MGLRGFVVALFSAVIFLATAGAGHATVIDFEALASSGGNVNRGSSYTEDGFTLTTNALFEFESTGSASSVFTGSTALLNNFTNGQTVLTENGGNPFTLNSIDLAELKSNVVPTVVFTGNLNGGGTVTQSFTLDGIAFGAETFFFAPGFTNLLSVSWIQANPFHQFDNIVVNGTNSVSVPEPGALAIFGLGLLGLGAVRRRRRRLI